MSDIDIADECEHRMDGYLAVDYHGDVADIVNITELHADLARYAAHMRQQAERIAELEQKLKQAIPIVEGAVWESIPEWLAEVKEILK